MTNEEIQRTMDFILAHQAQFAASMQKLEEERIRDAPRLALVEKSFQVLLRLAENTDARLDSVDSNASADRRSLHALEESFQVLVRLAENTDARLDSVDANSRAREARVDKLESGASALEVNMAALAASQAHADERLSALIDIVRDGRNNGT